jgi:hypothetical protein
VWIQPSINHLHVFGRVVFTHVPKEARTKLAKGFTQVEGINFNKIFSLVVQMEQFKLCL